jgi:hypothetical protein
MCLPFEGGFDNGGSPARRHDDDARRGCLGAIIPTNGFFFEIVHDY